MAKNPIAYFGNDGAGNFGGKVSRSGVDVFSAGPLDTLFSTDQPVMGVAEEGQMTIPPNVSGSDIGEYIFAQDFGYIPFVLVSEWAGPESSAWGVWSNFAGFQVIFPGPVFVHHRGFVTNVFSDRLTIRNQYNDASISVGITVFWQRTD